MARFRRLFLLLSLTLASGCLLIPETLLPSGAPFVMEGTMTLLDGDCLTWTGSNGVNYHLLQNPLLDTATFDRVNTPGASSRLVLMRRHDVRFPCDRGIVVEVQQVLEVSP